MPLPLSSRWLWSLLALLVGIAGISAVWVAAAVLSGANCSWLGLVAGADMALLLRLTNAPAGPARTLAAIVSTLVSLALAQWLVVATQIGVVLGIPPIASALNLGPHLAWQLTGLALGRVDWVLLAASPVLAAILTSAGRAAAAGAPAPSAPNPGT